MIKPIVLNSIIFAGICVVSAGVAAADPVLMRADEAQEGALTKAQADQLRQHRRLPFDPADIAAKAAADRAEAAARTAPGTTPQAAPVVPGTITNPISFAGQTDVTGTPPDTTGTIGPDRYIQLVNSRATIYNRSTGAVISSGTLDRLAGVAASVFSFDPQIHWDTGSNRFVYVMDSIFSNTDNRLSFGFSKTATPGNLTTDWCHYTLGFGSLFPDFPKLGNSRDFTLIGTNDFDGNAFVGSRIIAITKPPVGTGCPDPAAMPLGTVGGLRDSTGRPVFTPVPSVQVDQLSTGYVVARNAAMPSNRLWIFNVTKGTGGLPAVSAARPLQVPAYDFPANATQPVADQVLDTSDARMTNAVQAYNPARATNSFWTQHTIATSAKDFVAKIRVYEIDPVPAAPKLLRSFDIAEKNVYLFNASVSPDRRLSGALGRFGDSVVLTYSASSRAKSIFPQIVAGSSRRGGPVETLVVRKGIDYYTDFSCPNPGDVCRWGDYSGSSPDPLAPNGVTGQVWGTNQFSGVANPGPVDWRTLIFAIRP